MLVNVSVFNSSVANTSNNLCGVEAIIDAGVVSRKGRTSVAVAVTTHNWPRVFVFDNYHQPIRLADITGGLVP